MFQMHVLVVCEKYNLVLTEETRASFAFILPEIDVLIILACIWHNFSLLSLRYLLGLCDVHIDSLKFADHYTCRLCFVLELI